jgi:sugar lactone lactonase YvrE
VRPTDVEVLVATPHLDVGAAHAEGVVWDAARARLLFVDIPAGRVFDHDPVTGAVDMLEVGRPVGAVAPRANGGLVLAVREGFAVVDGGEVEVVAAPYGDDPAIRMNDGTCDPRGRFLAGSMGYGAPPGAGMLFRLDPDRSVRVLLNRVTISNGLDWSADGRRCFYVDTPTQRIDVLDYDLDVGVFGERRAFAAVDVHAGMPDGLTVDAEGNVWVALYGGGAVHRYAPDGRLTGRVEVPEARLVTSCCFGGPDLADLYVSTSTEDLDPAQLAAQPGAGHVFVVRSAGAGRPSPTYGG